MDTTGCAILLIDDEEANLDLLELMLRLNGYQELARVSDARQAVEAFDGQRPDLVLLDLHMPHRGGFEVLGDLVARTAPGEYLPVLVLTADITAEARERALAGGARDFVTKPFDKTEVLLRVRNLLETRMLYQAERRGRHAAERTAARDRLLAEASRVLGASLDNGTALASLCVQLAEEWADACAVRVGEGGGPMVHADSRPGAAPLFVEDEAAPGLLDAAEAARALGGGPWGSAVRVEVRGSGPSAGWIVAGRAPGRGAFGAEDLALAAELGRRAGFAVENARAFDTAQAALGAREQVLAVVAHDLRSPLTAVRFEVEMLRMSPDLPLAPADDETLERVQQAVARMDGLIQDLLDVTRASRGPLVLDRRPQPMSALLNEAASGLRTLVTGQGLAFHAEGPAALPVVAVDGARVLQVIGNLVGNAAKFAGDHGTVTLAWELADGEVRVSVTDDGPGIDPEQVQHIFGAFWQARHADRRGLGLGLAIARAIVEAHGGRIWVESEPGRGSAFFFTLPTRGKNEGEEPSA
ncbi:MAG TPA: ATP-binding protein [Longimicrobium sp.]|uniref:sensor histidine kinase n=1 Tax=Longimicrobium sp. TaxID=2029185 RepID=UPI002EDB1DDA